MVLGEQSAYYAIERLAYFWLRDAMLENMDPILLQLSLLYRIIGKEDTLLASVLVKSAHQKMKLLLHL